MTSRDCCVILCRLTTPRSSAAGALTPEPAFAVKPNLQALLLQVYYEGELAVHRMTEAILREEASLLSDKVHACSFRESLAQRLPKPRFCRYLQLIDFGAKCVLVAALLC